MSIFCLLIMIPISFAADGETAVAADGPAGNLTLDSGACDILSADKYYDSNNFTSSCIVSNSVLHLANGEYNIDSGKTISNVTIMGQNPLQTILNCNGNTFTVSSSFTLKNLTLINLKITNNGNLTATNTIFKDSHSTSNGGVITSTGAANKISLDNCTFSNNYAKCGGSIYLSKGNMTIANSLFENNHASLYGGSIVGYDNAKINIENSKFLNDYSIDDAGGAIYLFNSELMAKNLLISNCSSNFGGAITSLKSSLNLNNFTGRNNKAKYDGGAIYVMYRTFRMSNSLLENNEAINAGAVFVYNSDNFLINYTKFTNNHASNCAGAFYSVFLQEPYYDSILNSALHNTVYANDVLEAYLPDLFIGDSNVQVYNSYPSDISDLPSRYDLRQLGQVSGVENQGNDGNCWAFATLAALESSILKAGGGEFDFSEQNMKDLISRYSVYGWQMDTNNGGYSKMGYGYLASWLGPVNDSDDRYKVGTVLSPVLDGLMHVQNVLFLKRDNYTDNDEIKCALMNYGAVATPMCFYSSYLKNNKYYYYPYSNSANHLVAIVGWDDDLQISGAPGKGAWIAKNSWGTNWGENGYFYVSYYDTKFAQVGTSDSFVFVLNDTLRYDKNYQYDIPGMTDYFLNASKVVWYKNKFTATSSEYLAAVSTYFNKDANWKLYVYVNDELKLTQNGFSTPSYRTIELSKLIKLNEGDAFEVVFKITVDKEAGVPISEFVSLNTEFYRENISFISYDGSNWQDLYGLTWSYPSHTYASQVACIKAFTVFNKVIPKVTLSVDYDAPWLISADVKNPDGTPVKSGKITFTAEGNTFTRDVVDGHCELAYVFQSAGEKWVTAQFSRVGYTSPTPKIKVNVEPVSLSLSLAVEKDVLNARITARLDKNVSETVYFIINGHSYQCDAVKGVGVLELNNCYYGRYNVKAYTDEAMLPSNNASCSFTIDYLQTYIQASDLQTYYRSSVSYSVTIVDKAKKPISDKYVDFTVNGVTKSVKTNANGVATVELTNLVVGVNRINISCPDESKYLKSYKLKNINVLSTISILSTRYTYDSYYFVYLVDSNGAKLLNKSATLEILGDTYSYVTDSSVGRFYYNIKLDPGSYTFTVTNIETGEVSSTLIQVLPRVSSDVTTVMYGGFYKVKVLDNFANAVSNAKVTFKINGATYYNYTDSDGYASLKITLNPNKYTITASFKGFVLSNRITVKSTISILSTKYTYDSNYFVYLVDSNGAKLLNKPAILKILGETYIYITDSSLGRFYYNIKLDPGSYTFTVTNIETGEVSSTLIQVVARICENDDVAMYFGSGDSYRVKVLDNFGNAASNAKVTFKINGETYYRYTDSDGYASLKISLDPNIYTITASFKGYSVTNQVTVNHVIITSDLTVRRGEIAVFSLKLVNSKVKGAVLANKTITIKFRGSTYSVKTNDDGMAAFYIVTDNSFNIGNYKIISSFAKDSVTNIIKVIN